MNTTLGCIELAGTGVTSLLAPELAVAFCCCSVMVQAQDMRIARNSFLLFCFDQLAPCVAALWHAGRTHIWLVGRCSMLLALLTSAFVVGACSFRRHWLMSACAHASTNFPHLANAHVMQQPDMFTQTQIKYTWFCYV